MPPPPGEAAGPSEGLRGREMITAGEVLPYLAPDPCLCETPDADTWP